MGEVYRARDTRLDRDVAVKLLAPGLSREPRAGERFDREARLISQLSHPHICSVYDVGEYDGSAFIVMECLEGETLAGRLQQGDLPLAEALRIAIEVADALDHAHRRGIVHRDLKPGNVMLTKSGAKLLDFGVAKAASRAAGHDGAAVTIEPLTQAGVIVGTPLDHVVARCLEKDPDERWQSAFDVLCELRWIADPATSSVTAPTVTAGISTKHRPSPVMTSCRSAPNAKISVRWLDDP